MHNNHVKKFLSLALSIILFLFIVGCTPETDDETPIEFTGTVTVIDGNTITVGGFNVDISNASVPTSGFIIGDNVRVTGLSSGVLVVAVVVVPIEQTSNDDPQTPEPTAIIQTPTQASEPTAIVQTPTQAPEPTAIVQNPTQAPEATIEIEATTVPAIVVIDGEPLIVIEGPVQEININTIRIFDIDIEVNPADPILTQIRIGDTIRIEGQSSFEGTIIIIVAINIVIIETNIVVINNPVYIVPGIASNCRTTPRGRVTCRGSRRSSRGSRRS